MLLILFFKDILFFKEGGYFKYFFNEFFHGHEIFLYNFMKDVDFLTFF